MSRKQKHDDEDDDLSDGSGRQRIDKWLWAARFFKTRSLAAEAIDGGKVQVNGDRAKRSKEIQPGDEVRLRMPPYEWTLVIRSLATRRGPATEAQGLYEETEASRTARERLAEQLRAANTGFAHGEGKPTKKDRREIDRTRGRWG